MTDRSTQTSRMQSPIPQRPQVNFVHHPYLAGGLIGAGAAIPLTLLARAPIAKFGNYMKRAGYNIYNAWRNTPYVESNVTAYKRNHVNTANEKQYR